MGEIINAIHEQAGHTDMALSGLLYSKVIHLFCYNALDIIFVLYHIMSVGPSRPVSPFHSNF
jgi:hypothetical protein